MSDKELEQAILAAQIAKALTKKLIKGDRGKDGKDGRDGKDGVGLSGRKGQDGKQGVKGDRGEIGPRGLAGKDGKDGKDGQDGRDGKDGAKGDPGPGLPPGGQRGFVPIKASDRDFDVKWGPPPEVETILMPGGGSGGGGAVKSINGKTGDVVLDAADVGATNYHFGRTLLADRPAASAANNEWLHETTDPGARTVTRSDGAAHNKLPLVHIDDLVVGVPVSEFGAYGVGDETEELQAALDWCAAAPGRCIELKNGSTYTVTTLTLNNARFAIVRGNKAKIVFTRSTDGPAFLIQDSRECIIDGLQVTTSSSIVDAFELRNTGGSTVGGMTMDTISNCKINFAAGWPGCRRGIYISDTQTVRDNNSEHLFYNNDICQFKQSGVCINSKGSLQNTIYLCRIFNSYHASYSLDCSAIETMSELVEGVDQGGGGLVVERCILMASGGVNHASPANTCWLMKLQGVFYHEVVISNCFSEDYAGFLYVNCTWSDAASAVPIRVTGFYHKSGRQPASGYLKAIELISAGASINLKLDNVSTHQGRLGVRFEIGRYCALYYYGGIMSAQQIGGIGRFSGLGYAQTPGTMTFDTGHRASLREIDTRGNKFIHGTYDSGYIAWMDHYEGDGTTNYLPLTNARTPTAHNHAGSEITSGSIDGDRLSAPTETKRGGVKAVGTPSGKFLRDDDAWEDPPGVPDGGSTGQKLAKKSNTDQDVEWVDDAIGGAIYNQPTGSPITLADDEAVVITHQAVTSMKMQTCVWYDTESGDSDVVDTSIDFDSADAAEYTLQDSVNSELAGGLYKLANIGGDSSAHPTTGMSDNSTPSPYVASASTEYNASYQAWEAFDKVDCTDGTNNRWASTNSSGNWLKIDLGAQKVIVSYRLQHGQAATSSRTWTVSGSNNNSDWTTVDTQTTVAAWSNYEARTFTLSNPAKYRYWRFSPSESGVMEVGEWTLNEAGTLYAVSTHCGIKTPSFSTAGVSLIASVVFTETVPANTATRYAVSFDDSASWKVWNTGTSEWDTISAGTTGTNGNTKADMETGLTDLTITDQSSLTFDVDIYTTSATATPSVSLITITYDQITSYALAPVVMPAGSGGFSSENLDATRTRVTNLTGDSQKVYISVITPPTT